MGRMKKEEKGKSNLHAEEDIVDKLESMSLNPRLSKLIQKYQEVFGALPPPRSCKELVQMDLKLEPEIEGSVVRRRPYPPPTRPDRRDGTNYPGMHRCWPRRGI